MASAKRSSKRLVVVDEAKPGVGKKRSKTAERPAARRTSSDPREEEVERLPRRLRGAASGDDLIGISRRLHDRLKGVCADCIVLLLVQYMAVVTLCWSVCLCACVRGR